MPAKIIDGKKIAEKILNGLKSKIKSMKEKPGLAIVLVGDNPASEIYVSSKEKTFKEVEGYCERHNLDKDVSEMDLLNLVTKLNNNPKVHGILVQLPLPKGFDTEKIITAIDPKKDADCLHPENFGKFVQANEEYSIVAPATPFGIVRLLEEYKVKIEGKHAIVVGRSNIVGKPVAQLLLNRGATVTVCHRHTKNLAAFTRQADILVVAAGKRNLIRANMVKRGAIVIDVGVNHVGKKIFGDVDFGSVSKKASYITPVPGGVGPVTIAMLLWNTVRLAKK